jgi:transcriptional regulator with XRE-family HTH domain
VWSPFSWAYFLGGPACFHLLPGSWVGGIFLSPGSMVTFLGLGIWPPLGPVSIFSPGRCGFSPGFCSDILNLRVCFKAGSATVLCQLKINKLSLFYLTSALLDRKTSSGTLENMTKKTIEPFYQTVGRRIYARRTELGLTQEQVGSKLIAPLTRAAIANIETGKQRILAHTLVELASILGVELAELVPQKTEPLDMADIKEELTNKLPTAAKSLLARLESLNKEDNEHTARPKRSRKTR